MEAQMENIKQLKEKAYAIAVDDFTYTTKDRIEAMKAYAFLTIAENNTIKED
jgi:c-di-GMP-related signal transduction protein